MATQTIEKRMAAGRHGTLDLEALTGAIDRFNAAGQLGQDPLAALYPERRKGWSLFSNQLFDAEIEALRPYIFPYRQLPEQPTDEPVPAHNLIAGVWHAAEGGETAIMHAPWDDRVPLARLAASGPKDVERVLSTAHGYWESLEWAQEVVTYRKWVVANFSRILDYYYEDILTEIRHQIPKTRIEADKDFWEAKRAADHIGGNADKAMQGELAPQMMAGHSYWKNPYLPAGVCVLLTPMNFIYGIPGIQMVGCYMSGSPMVFKGHPLAAITNTVLMRMLLAAGAEPRAIYKMEGFGKGISTLATDHRVAVVSLTGSEATAKAIAAGRGVRTLRFEGGGCNWAWVDDGYSDPELRKIAERLAYSKLGFSSHKCTTLHGIAARPETLSKLVKYVNTEMDAWEIRDPRRGEDVKVVGPNMVHQAQTVSNIQEAASQAGYPILRKGGKVTGSDYADHAQVVAPVVIGGLKPVSMVACDWDGKGVQEFNLTTTEFFMPILCAMPLDGFDEFLRFCLLTNPHDLACSIWTRDDRQLQRARQLIGGMLKENDGTDSALEWEEFGASGIGDSGNMGVGDASATIGIFCRRQKGRHVVF